MAILFTRLLVSLLEVVFMVILALVGAVGLRGLAQRIAGGLKVAAAGGDVVDGAIGWLAQRRGVGGPLAMALGLKGASPWS